MNTSPLSEEGSSDQLHGDPMFPSGQRTDDNSTIVSLQIEQLFKHQQTWNSRLNIQFTNVGTLYIGKFQDIHMERIWNHGSQPYLSLLLPFPYIVCFYGTKLLDSPYTIGFELIQS